MNVNHGLVQTDFMFLVKSLTLPGQWPVSPGLIVPCSLSLFLCTYWTVELMSCCLLPPDQNSEVIKREFTIESDQKTPKITRNLSYHSLRLTSTFPHTWIHNFSTKFSHDNRLIRMVPSWVGWGGKLLCNQRKLWQSWSSTLRKPIKTCYILEQDIPTLWAPLSLCTRWDNRSIYSCEEWLGGSCEGWRREEGRSQRDCSIAVQIWHQGRRGKNVINEKWTVALQWSWRDSGPWLPASCLITRKECCTTKLRGLED